MTILTDASGDSTGGDPAKDVLSLSIAEPNEIGAGKLEFILRVASLASPGQLFFHSGWIGLAPDDSVLISAQTGSSEIYALDLEWP